MEAIEAQTDFAAVHIARAILCRVAHGRSGSLLCLKETPALTGTARHARKCEGFLQAVAAHDRDAGPPWNFADGEIMKRYVYGILYLSFVLIGASGWVQGQDAGQLPSPPAKTNCSFADGKTITVNYSSPRMRGRKIFGGLVPYGEVWRAGANEATALSSSGNLVVEGTALPAGNYTLFTLPNPDKWQLIISKQTGEWGIPYPGASFDFARVPMQLSKLPAPLQDFAIAFDKEGNNCRMRLDWETTRASVEFSEKK